MYSHTYNEERYSAIQKVIQEISDLKPSEKLAVRGYGAEEGERVRWLIYDWMHHLGIKKLYRIKSMVLPGDFSVHRLGPAREVKLTVVREEITGPLEDRLRQIVPMERDDVEATLLRWLEEKEINLKDMQLLIEHWERVNS